MQISRSEMYLIDLTDTTKNVDALEGSRDVVEGSSLDPKPFAFSGVSKLTGACLCVCVFDWWNYV